MPSLHTDDLLEKLDRALAFEYLPPATRCGYCCEYLTPGGPSLDFCNTACQSIWHLDRTNGHAPDGGWGQRLPHEMVLARWTARITGRRMRDFLDPDS